MTPTQRAAMEQALEVLEHLQGGCTDSDDGTVEAITVWCPEVIDDLRAALAETAPAVELTDEEIDALWQLWLTKKYGAVTKDEGRVFARAAIAAHEAKRGEA
jgi:hypothetical protein